MINFFYETSNPLLDEERLSLWLRKVIISEDRTEGEISFIFCDDAYLLKINQEYLNHDAYTDIISFDTTIGNKLGGDIFISLDRVFENANTYGVSVDDELRRVMIHGVLHFCGYKDKTRKDEHLMRQKEDEKLSMFHVEQ